MPVNNREYVHLKHRSVELYIEKGLINGLPPKGGVIYVYMGDYGCWTIGIR
jgi:hypothetical protein